MQPFLVICIILAQLCCSCSYALPLLAPEDQAVSERVARASGHHDYVLTIFDLRKEILAAHCNKTFNGQPVSQHFCETNKIKFFPLEQEVINVTACRIDFAIELNGRLRETALGGDLAIYKLMEVDTSPDKQYDIYISHKIGNRHIPITRKTVPSANSGWQIFNIDEAAVQWQSGKNQFTLSVSLVRSDGAILPCTSISSLFIISDSENQVPEESLVNVTQFPEDVHNYVPAITAFTATQSTGLCNAFPELCSRQKRSALHNYLESIFQWRQQHKDTNCTAPFNGQSVSSLHCFSPARVKIFFSQEQDEVRDTLNFCDVRFNIIIEQGDVLLGADLAIYKLPDPNADENTYYTVYLIQQDSAQFFDLIGTKTIPATSSEWQVFHIDDVTSFWEAGETEFVLKLYVVANPTVLTCTEVSSKFVLRIQPTGSESNIGSGDINLYPDTSNREDYVPLVTVFATGNHPWIPSTKRSIDNFDHLRMNKVGVQETKADEKDGTGCQVQDHEVSLSSIIPDATVIYPTSANIKKCSALCTTTTTHKEQAPPSVSIASQCLPTEYSDLEVLLKRRDEPEAEYTIETITDAIVEGCSCM